MATRPIPTTCREAAARFREWAERTPYEQDMHRLALKRLKAVRDGR
jgi:hypothetical protein